jgi:hypothetical protein
MYRMPREDRDPSAAPALDRLLRWENFGGHWRVSSRTATHLELRLLTCDGGEEADRFVTDEQPTIRYVGARSSDQDD